MVYEFQEGFVIEVVGEAPVNFEVATQEEQRGFLQSVARRYPPPHPGAVGVLCGENGRFFGAQWWITWEIRIP